LVRKAFHTWINWRRNGGGRCEIFGHPWNVDHCKVCDSWDVVGAHEEHANFVIGSCRYRYGMPSGHILRIKVKNV